MPTVIDEVQNVPVPAACSQCGGAVDDTHVVAQYQEDLPPVRPVVRRFDVHIGRCRRCGRRVQGRHPLQTSDAVGAAAVQLGPQALATPLISPQTAPVDELEPLTAGAMQRFLATHSTLEDLPMAVSLRAFYHVTISGEPGTVRGTARAVVACLAALHSAEDLVVAVATGRETAPEWEWAKWLPHTQTRGVADGAGSMRLITIDPMELEDRLAGVLQGT